jgi:hypothetical protein
MCNTAGMNNPNNIHPSRIIQKGHYMHDIISACCPIYDPVTESYQVMLTSECSVMFISYVITEDGDYVFRTHHVEEDEEHVHEIIAIEYEVPVEQVREDIKTFDTFWEMVEENLPELIDDPEEI